MAGMGRRIRNALKGAVVKTFHVGQRFGIDVLPRHFYSNVPDVRELRRTRYWRGPMSMAGVRGVELADQLAFVASCCPDDVVEHLRRADVYGRAQVDNEVGGYGPVEADFLYAFVRTKRPRRVVQVGAGVSTGVILRAAAEGNFAVEVVCVEPYPTPFLENAARNSGVKLVREMAQKVDLGVLTGVGEQGMLFVDSTHAVRPGGEVNRIILEVLPRLPKGTLVHFHDIPFPYDYGRDVLRGPFFGGEHTLLQAYLADNARYTVRASLSMLHYAAPVELQRYLPHYRPAPGEDGLGLPGGGGDFPSSIYLEAVN